MTNTRVAIGIDLGTTKCCVGVVRDGKVEILENERSSKTTPAYVAFTDTERLVGEDARDQAALNPTNTVFGVKGFIGRNLDQAMAHCEQNRLPFEIVALAGEPRIRVKYKGAEKLFSAEQISAMLLIKMKKMAESYLGCQVTDAVISVPAHFNNSQRQATKAAAAIAGLEVLRLVSAPTAAALTLALNRRSAREETVLMLDVGGGTVDASVVDIKEDCVNVTASQGDCHCGGESIDVSLVQHLIDEFREVHGRDLSGNKKVVERLRRECRKVKHTLSLLPMVHLQLDSLIDDIDFESKVSRSTFDTLCSELVSNSLLPLLVYAGDTVDREIDHIVMIGGSSRVPKIHKTVSDFFGKELTKTINVDEAVANGAAVVAASLLGDGSFGSVKVSDVTPHSIDYLPPFGSVERIVKENRTIPFQDQVRGTSKSESVFCEFVHYWNTSRTEYNLLGCHDVELSSSEEGRGLEVNYGIDGDGIFFASVRDPSKGPGSAPDHVEACIQAVNKTQLAEMHQETEVIEEEDKENRRKLVALSELESYCFAMKQSVSELMKGSLVGREVITQSCDETLDWLDMDPNISKEAILSKRKELDDLFALVREQTAA